MDLEELLTLLDIDTPDELVFFEQFAELMEGPYEIPFETLTALADGMDSDMLSELVEGYFEDVLKFVPDEEDELYTLLTNIGTTLSTLAENNEDDAARIFAEELYKFRSWYLFEHCILCTNITEGTESEITMIEALTNYRVQNFTDEDFIFDFTDALDYPLEEYVVSLSSLLEDNYNDDEYQEDDDYIDPDSYD